MTTELWSPWVALRETERVAADPQAEAEWSAGRSWVEQLYPGTFHHYVARKPGGKSQRSVTFTEEDIRGMPAVFRKAQAEGYWPGGGPKVDINHALAFGSCAAEETKARARIVDLRVKEWPGGDRPGQQLPAGTPILEALYEWTAAGVETRASGDFAGTSVELVHPDFALSKVDEKPLGGWLVEGATFCNDPMIQGLRLPDLPVPPAESLQSARTVMLLSRHGQQRPAEEQTPMTLPLVTSRLKLRAEASDQELSVAVEAIQDELKTSTETLSVREQAIVTLKAERDTLRTERDTLLSAQRDSLVARFVKEGRVKPAKKDGLLRILDGETKVSGWDKAVAFVEDLFEAGKTEELGTLRGHGETGDDALTAAKVVAAVETEVARLVKAEGLDQATLELRTQAEDTVLARPGHMTAYLNADFNPHEPQA